MTKNLDVHKNLCMSTNELWQYVTDFDRACHICATQIVVAA